MAEAAKTQTSTGDNKSEQDAILNAHEAKGDRLHDERIAQEQVDLAGSEKPGSPDEPPAESSMDPQRAALFVSKIFFKTLNRFIPEAGFGDKDIQECAEVLAPVMKKHESEMFGFMEKWGEELMLGMTVFNIAADGYDRIKAARIARQDKGDLSETVVPTSTETALDKVDQDNGGLTVVEPS